ncbi:glutathione S-transferase 3, mitochondrial-like [Mytilus trossulus]|uniref:glutathione S-transferase 3, mitochondrial-like n=1 Tax=Mytilus trossulus TaxID=6551 RepID=UPI003005D70A
MAIVSKFPQGYGYVVLTGVGSAILLQWMVSRVFNTRRKVKDIEYPGLYHPGQEKMNCVVRAHQNILEGYPVFLMVLFVGGLQRPKICASAGCVWIVGQVAYVYGYCSDDKTNRRYGKCIGYLGLLTMFGCTVEFGVRELMHKRLFHTAVGVKNVMTTKAKGLLPSVLKKQDR